ncbi:ABC-type transport auxiliary lipoprotein family protein [Sulfurimonas sp.]
MKYIIISLVALLFSGCISTATPAKSEFRVNSHMPSKKFTSLACKSKSLKVAQAFSPSSIMSNTMSYAQGDFKQYAYSASQWSVAPNKAITAEFLTMIRDSKLFKSVQISKSRSRNDFILEISIEDFMQYFNDSSTSSYANVAISLALIDSKTNNVFATKIFNSKEDVKSLDAKGGVDGLNSALSDVISQSNDWLGEVCK